MNAIVVKEKLIEDSNLILQIIESLGFSHIEDKGRYFHFPNLDGDNIGAITLYKDTLKYINHTRGRSGNIFTLVMEAKHILYIESLIYICNLLDIVGIDEKPAIKLPFGGFYKKISQQYNEPELSMPIYNESILAPYGTACNMQFWKDGIDLLTQNKFHLGYDNDTDRIAIPQWNVNGNLVGIMGRSNDPEIPHELRWLPILPCSRSYTLYGYHMNYAAIQMQDMCIITESEKGVMQMSSMGYSYGLATCGKNISRVQQRYIKALGTPTLIVAFDQGVEEEELRIEAQKLLINNDIYKNRVGYIYDKNGDILQGKESPTDKGKNAFKALVRDYITWI